MALLSWSSCSTRPKGLSGNSGSSGFVAGVFTRRSWSYLLSGDQRGRRAFFAAFGGISCKAHSTAAVGLINCACSWQEASRALSGNETFFCMGWPVAVGGVVCCEHVVAPVVSLKVGDKTSFGAGCAPNNGTPNNENMDLLG